MINDEPGVAAATVADRVTVAIQELGFQRNDLARSLRQGVTSSTLGLVIEDVGNPFYSGDRAGRRVRGARERGFMLITASCEEDPARERELVQALLRRRVDALLLVPASDATTRTWRARPPTAPLSCSWTARRRAWTPGRAAGQPRRRALGHRAPARPRAPADRGRRRPRRSLYTAAERLAGYRQALEAAGVRRCADGELLRLGSHDVAQGRG